MENRKILQVLYFVQIRMYHFVKHIILQNGIDGGIFKSQRGTPDEGTPQETPWKE